MDGECWLGATHSDWGFDVSLSVYLNKIAAIGLPYLTCVNFLIVLRWKVWIHYVGEEENKIQTIRAIALKLL